MSRSSQPPMTDSSSLTVLDKRISLLKRTGDVLERVPEKLPALARVMDTEMAKRIFRALARNPSISMDG